MICNWRCRIWYYHACKKCQTFSTVTIKYKNISDINLKVLHNILPCNKNVLSWKKSNSKYCTACSQEETIEYLLYHCEYAQIICKYIKYSMSIEVSFIDLNCGLTWIKQPSYIISIISFVIYKDRFITSLNNNLCTNKKPECLQVSYISENMYINIVPVNGKIYDAYKTYSDTICNNRTLISSAFMRSKYSVPPL